MKGAGAARIVRQTATGWKIMIDDIYNAKILGFAGNIAGSAGWTIPMRQRQPIPSSAGRLSPLT